MNGSNLYYSPPKRRTARHLLTAAAVTLAAAAWAQASMTVTQVTGSGTTPAVVTPARLDTTEGDGEFLFTYALYHEMRPGQFFWHRFTGWADADSLTDTTWVGDIPGGLRADIEWAKDQAWVAANNMAGFDVPLDEVLLVESVAPNGAAEAAGIVPGDLIVSVDGDDEMLAHVLATDLLSDERAAVVEVDRQGDTLFLLVNALPWSDTPEVGISVSDHSRLLGVRPDVRTRTLTGPSVGLMATLAYFDYVTEGDLTAGLTVAGTGTVDAHGWAGPVGNVEVKVEAAYRDGADVFFVDPYDYQEAANAAPEGFRVVQVENAWDAVDWLCRHGADIRHCDQAAFYKSYGKPVGRL